MSVWIVTENCCNHLEAVFATEELAKAYCDRMEQGYSYFEAVPSNELPEIYQPMSVGTGKL